MRKNNLLNMATKLRILLGAVICIVILAASFTFVSAQEEEITPETRVKTFYSWYLKWTNEKHDLTKNKDAMNYYLSARFSGRLYSKEVQNADYNIFVDSKEWNNAWLKNIKVGEAAITGDNAVLKLILSAPPDGPVMTLQISLVKEGSDWKIDGVTAIEMDKNAPPTTTAAVGNSGVAQSNPTGSFGSMNYSAPAGWSEQKFSDGVLFKPVDLPPNEQLVLQIMPPLNGAGTMEQALEQSFVEATAMYKGTHMYEGQDKYRKNAPQVSFKGWEYIRGKGGIRVQNGTEGNLELFVIKVNNRFERVAILESRLTCQTFSQQYYTSDRLSYRNGIETLLFSLQFADLNETGLNSGSANGNGIVGVWTGISQSTGAAVGLRLVAFSPIFLDNGQVYFGEKFPTQGLEGLNTRIPPELYPRNWGTYTFSNGTGSIKMPYANFPIRMEGNNLIITKDQRDWQFSQLDSVDGATFNGTYNLGAVNGSIPSITFTSDGRFTDNGALKVLHHDLVDCANPAANPGSGTYLVKDYSVLFTYSDGRIVKLAFSGAGYTKGNPSPEILRMSYREDTLTRQ